MTKRKATDVPTTSRKKQSPQDAKVNEARPIHEQTAPFLLVTAKFPIDALTAEWSVGVNRPIDAAHKRRLCQIFDEAGVLRRDTTHQLQIACSKEHVDLMLDQLKEEGQTQRTATPTVSEDEGSTECVSFHNWMSVVSEKAELLTGHHRVEAFKEHLRLRQLGEEERWWVCRIYDRGQGPCTCLAPRVHANRSRHATAALARSASGESG